MNQFVSPHGRPQQPLSPTAPIRGGAVAPNAPLPGVDQPGFEPTLDAALGQTTGNQAKGQVPEWGEGDGLESITLPGQTKETDMVFVRRLYMELLHREPDPKGLADHVNGLSQGMTREAIRQVFLDSAEYKALQAKGPGAPPLPGGPQVPAPGANAAPAGNPFGSEEELQKAVQHAAKRALETQIERAGPLPANATKSQEKKYYYDMITMVVAQLRQRGLDVERLARHTQNPVGNPGRYVNDAIVLPDGRAIDLYGGEGFDVQFHDLDVPSPKTDRNTGITDPGLPASSSTLGL